MVLVNYSTRELTAKLVYYGPGLCGKTTNLQYVFDNLLPKDRRGKMVSLATETDRTLFFDFLPLELGTIRGLKTRLQLYTVPGQVHYNATRKIVLKGADGIVFVADSQASKREGNIESFKNMKANLAEHGLDLKAIPHVIQLNKRDLPDVMSIEQMYEDLNEYNAPFFEAVAVQGIGVEDTLKGISKLVLKNLAGRFQPGAEAPPAAAPEPVAAAATPTPMAPEPAVPGESARPVLNLPPALAPAPAAPAFAPAPAAPVLAPAPVFAPSPAPSMAPPPPTPPPSPHAAPAPIPAAASAGNLEDMLLGGAPSPMPSAPLPAASGDVFGFEAPKQPAGGGNLEDMLLGGPSAPVEAEPEIIMGDDLMLPSPEEEALLRGDTVLSTEMMAPPAAAASPFASPAGSPFASPAGSPFDAPGDMEAALLSGDTVMSPAPMPGVAPSAKDYEFDAALLSGDTVMSPSPFEPPRPLDAPAPAAAMAAPAPDALDAGYELPLSDEDAIPLSSDDILGGSDLESSLLASPAPPVAAPVPAPAAAAPGAIDIPPIHIGAAAPGSLVERTLRVPITYTDAAGQHQTTLEVTLKFKVG